LNKLDTWTCLYNDIKQTDVHIYSESSSDDDDEKMDDQGDSSSSSSSSSDEDEDEDKSIEIEAPDSIPNETPDDYYHRTREFWLGEARKELKLTDTTDDSVRVQHLAQQISKLFFQS
jgi:hypothetical protein